MDAEEAPPSAVQLEEVNSLIDHQRSALSPSQLRRLRKKRGKLAQQAVHEQLNEQPAAKRLCLDAEEQQQQQPSMSLQLSGHGPGSLAADTDQEAASWPHAAAHKQLHQQHHPGGSSMQQQQGEPPTDPRQHIGSRHKLPMGVPAPTSSTTSTGPCRTDLSGQLVVIQQVLSGNTADHSNSTASQLLLQQYSGQHAASAAAAAAGSDCSHGTQPAAGAAAPAATSIQQLQQQQQQQDQPMSRKRGRPSCQYGNYHHYYGYRLKPSGFEDPRLKVLEPSWFHGADVLDVGCNEGLLTLALAVHCGCRSVCGVDIDPVLVAKACTNLSRSRSQLNQQLHQAVRDRNAQSMMAAQPRLQLEQPQQQQQQEPQQPSQKQQDAPPQQQQQQSPPQQPAEQQEQAKSPLDIIAASSMKPPASKRSKTASRTAAAAASGTAAHIQAHASNGNASAGATATVAAAAAGSDASIDKQPVQQQQRQPPHALTSQQQQQQQRPQARILSAQRQIKALSRVSFRAGNWLELPCPSNKYEVITCFSVTKWIQLNWGDDGIMQLFHKFYRCLAPGGLLVLEPQPFKSYKNAVHKPGVQAAPFVNLGQLKLRPEQYGEFLTQRVGFELVQQLGAVSEAAGAEAVSVKGFDRPILVLRKPAKQGAAGAGKKAAG